MTNLIDLPPEVLMKIFLDVSIDDVLCLAQTCKAVHEICDIPSFWDKKIEKDFKIKVKRDDTEIFAEGKIPAKEFYKHMLYEYGSMIGLWQAASISNYGSIFQVCN